MLIDRIFGRKRNRDLILQKISLSKKFSTKIKMIDRLLLCFESCFKYLGTLFVPHLKYLEHSNISEMQKNVIIDISSSDTEYEYWETV